MSVLRGVQGEAFDISLSGFGTFRKSILWAAVAYNDALNYLKASIDSALESASIGTKCLGFTPHIKLCRPRMPILGKTRGEIMRLALNATWRVAEFHLYRSRLEPAGAIHEIIETFKLK